MASDQEIRTKIVRKLARKGVSGSKKFPTDAVKRFVSSEDRGRAKQIVEEMMKDPEEPLEPAGTYTRCRLSSIDDAREYLEENGSELPFGLMA